MNANWAQEFPLQSGLIHLNHAGVGPWPKCTAEAIMQFTNENSHRSTQNISKWEQVEAKLRQLCKQLINAENANDTNGDLILSFF